MLSIYPQNCYLFLPLHFCYFFVLIETKDLHKSGRCMALAPNDPNLLSAERPAEKQKLSLVLKKTSKRNVCWGGGNYTVYTAIPRRRYTGRLPYFRNSFRKYHTKMLPQIHEGN